ncbi:MAG: hypothetical protein IJN50_04460 [Clostridia bacterium]|nr:hypothetical protein [Clostridia bacterium]
MESFFDIIRKIKEQNFKFDTNEFLEYVRFSIIKIYNGIYNNKIDSLYDVCSKELINTMTKNKDTFRLSKNIDNFQIQFSNIHDYVEKNNEEFIKVYLSIFCYDKTLHDGDYFWNDIWIVTLKKEISKNSSNIFECDKCGATMTLKDSILSCNYCNNKKMLSNYYSQWKIVDIVVQK